MKGKRKKAVILSQIVIVLAFFAGMMLNYFILIPVIDKAETSRLITDIDVFCKHFHPDCGCNLKDTVQMDSLVRQLDPYGCLDFFILDGDGRILYSKNGGTGNGYELITSRYGKMASRLLKSERSNPNGKDKMEYDGKAFLSIYADYVPSQEVMFFYAVDYRVAGEEVYARFMRLLKFMLAGGLMVILISYLINRIFRGRIREELQIRQELDTAANIQRSMLPRGEKHLIQLDVNARIKPAKKVGGDFYSYLLRDGLLYFCIGDVSGKGVPAALFMSKAVTLFRSCANAGLSVKEMASNLNNELCENNDQSMFLTGIVGIMHAFNGRTTYVNAGHEPPVIWNGENGSAPQYLSSKGNIPFGVMPDNEFEEDSYEMPRNSLLLLYTDGISEAKSRKKGLLGRDALLNILNPVKERSSKEVNDCLMDYVSRYESGTEQSDDITILTFKNSPTPKKLRIRNEISELKKIAPFTEEIFKECLTLRKDHILVRSGLDEALTNCVLYAYDSPGNLIDVTATVEKSRLCFTVEDSGKPFNPLEYSSESPGGELRIGGLGISIYKANFDEVRYTREADRNILKLIKNL